MSSEAPLNFSSSFKKREKKKKKSLHCNCAFSKAPGLVVYDEWCVQEGFVFETPKINFFS